MAGLAWPYLLGFFGTLALIGVLGVLTVSWRRRLRMRGSRRLWMPHVSLAALLCLSFLCAVEAYFAFLYDTTDAWGVLNTSQLWFRRHAAKTNNLSARGGRMLFPERRGEEFRIFFLGDSFTWGHGVPREQDRFTELIQRELGSRSTRGLVLAGKPARQVECANIAYLGVDTGEELEILRHLLADGFQFDMLVLVYCMNDIADLVPECRSAVDLVYADPPKCFLVRHTYAVNFLYYRWRSLTGGAAWDYYAAVGRGYDGPAWDQQRKRLSQFVRLARDAGVELRVVTFPFLHELRGEYPLASAHAQLARFWEELAVPHIDLLNTLRAHAGSQLTVNRFDPHPNERAHLLAAREILSLWFAEPTGGMELDHER